MNIVIQPEEHYIDERMRVIKNKLGVPVDVGRTELHFESGYNLD